MHFVQTVADLSSRPQNIDTLQTAGQILCGGLGCMWGASDALHVHLHVCVGASDTLCGGPQIHCAGGLRYTVWGASDTLCGCLRYSVLRQVLSSYLVTHSPLPLSSLSPSLPPHARCDAVITSSPARCGAHHSTGAYSLVPVHVVYMYIYMRKRKDPEKIVNKLTALVEFKHTTHCVLGRCSIS